MSLDNVLAVAGAAREHPGILIVGLIFAVALMGLAANIIARYIERYRWIAYVGLAVIVYVAVKMIYEGWVDPMWAWPAVRVMTGAGRAAIPSSRLSSGRPPAAIAVVRTSGPRPLRPAERLAGDLAQGNAHAALRRLVDPRDGR